MLNQRIELVNYIFSIALWPPWKINVHFIDLWQSISLAKTRLLTEEFYGNECLMSAT